MKVLNMFKTFVYPAWIIFIPAYVHWKRVVIVFVAQITCCILVILTEYYVIRACNISDKRVWMWLDREEKNRVVFLLFSCLSQERAVHYTIILIPTMFLPYAPVSNCYLVTIFFICIIHKKFEFTSDAHSWSFASIIILCRLGFIHFVFLSYYCRERTELNWKLYMICPFPNKNWCECQKFYIHPRSAVDLAQWDLGIMHDSEF